MNKACYDVNIMFTEVSTVSTLFFMVSFLLCIIVGASYYVQLKKLLALLKTYRPELYAQVYKLHPLQGLAKGDERKFYQFLNEEISDYQELDSTRKRVKTLMTASITLLWLSIFVLIYIVVEKYWM